MKFRLFRKIKNELFDETGYRYSGETTIAIGTTIFGVVLSLWLTTAVVNLFQGLVIGMLAVIFVYLILFTFKIKHDLTWKLAAVYQDVRRVLGPHTWIQFQERATHFAEEKQILCEELVVKHLPETIEKCCQSYLTKFDTLPRQVDIIIDSGTTLTPFFLSLKRNGLKFNSREQIMKMAENQQNCSRKDEKFERPITIHTNSISGVNEFNRSAPTWLLRETDLELFGGAPLGSYQATTGIVTEKAIEELTNNNSTVSDRLIISVLTANWILVGDNRNELHLCARGRGHRSFKEVVAQNSNCVIVVAPFGKLLRTSNIDRLNALDLVAGRDEKYRGFRLSDKVKPKCPVYLMTTFRTRKSETLFKHYEQFMFAVNTRAPSDFEFIGLRGGEVTNENLIYNPGGQEKLNRAKEIPHSYIGTDPSLLDL